MAMFDDVRGMYPQEDEETLRMKIQQDPEFARQSLLQSLSHKPIDAEIQAKYSPENRKALEESLSGRRTGTMVAQAFGGLGDIIAGKGPSAAPYEAAREKLDSKVAQFDKDKAAAYGDLFQKEKLGEMKSKQEIEARENDPMSQESKVAKEAAKRMGYQGDLESLTASQFKRFSPAFEKIYSIEQNKLARQDTLAARAQERQMASAAKEMAKEEQKVAKAVEKSRLTDTQGKEIGDLDAALSMVDYVKTSKEQSGIDTGPVSSRMNAVAQTLGIDDPEKTKFKATVQDQLAQYIKSMSGATVSPSERASLLETMPTMNDNDSAFNAKLESLKQRIGNLRENKIQTYQKLGKDVSAFEKAPGSQERQLVKRRNKRTGEIATFDAVTGERVE